MVRVKPENLVVANCSIKKTIANDEMSFTLTFEDVVKDVKKAITELNPKRHDLKHTLSSLSPVFQKYQLLRFPV